MLYSQTDRTQAITEQKKRRWLVVLPTALLLALAFASFVWFRLHHSTSGWPWTALLTVLSGAYFIFFYEVYLRPVSLYRRHVEYMLTGKKREAVGFLREVSDTPIDKDGMDCFSITINIGQNQNPDDDRLFYLDALKPMPVWPLGSYIKVSSNDRMVADLELIQKEI
jgi:hypothetical protein